MKTRIESKECEEEAENDKNSNNPPLRSFTTCGDDITKFEYNGMKLKKVKGGYIEKQNRSELDEGKGDVGHIQSMNVEAVRCSKKLDTKLFDILISHKVKLNKKVLKFLKNSEEIEVGFNSETGKVVVEIELEEHHEKHDKAPSSKNQFGFFNSRLGH